MFKKICTIFLMFSMLCSCGGNSPLDVLKGLFGGKGQEKIRIGVSFPSKYEARWVRDLEYLRQAAKEAEITLYEEVSDKNAALQEAQCGKLIDKGISVLIIAPHDALSAGAIAAKAKAAGVKVISYDRLAIGGEVDFYVSFDNIRVGELQAEYITKTTPHGNYVLFSGATTDNNSKMFRSGAMNVLEPLESKGKIRIIADVPIENWDEENAEMLMEEIIAEKGTDINAVIAPNDRTAGGIIKALEKHNMAGIVQVTGQDADFDAAKRIMSGMQTMTVFKDPRSLVAAALGAAQSMASGQRPPSTGKYVYNGRGQVESLLLEPMVLDKGNLVQTLMQTRFITEEQAKELSSMESMVFADVDDIELLPALTGGH